MYAAKEEGLIFVYQKSRKYNNMAIQQIVKSVSKKAEIKKKITPHTPWDSFAAHLLESGADILYIQHFLDHKDLKITQIYTYVANKDIKELQICLEFYKHFLKI